MMTRVFAAAMVAAGLASGALAQGEDAPQPLNVPSNSARADGLLRGEDLIEADLYRMGSDTGYDWASRAPITEIGEDWEDIGEIEDIVLNDRGELAGVLVDVGGFLGVGDKSILIPIEEIRLARGDEAGSVAYVTRFGEELLEEWPAVGEDYWE